MSCDEPQEDEFEYSPASPTSTVATLPLDDLVAPPPSPAVIVPVIEDYHVADVPGVDNEQGLFATHDIEQGTRIIVERPLFTLPHPGDQLPELMTAYSNLSPSDRIRVDSLRAADLGTTDQLSNITDLTNKLFTELKDILVKPEPARTDNERLMFDLLMPKFTNAIRVLRVAARWHANRCSMTNVAHDRHSSLPPGTPVSGLFMQRALMRHTCVPNCFASFDAPTNRLTVHATRPIAQGEELTVPAFADEMYYLGAAARKARFAQWGLACTCEACTPTHPAYLEHEAARLRTHTRAVLLNDFFTRLELFGSDAVADSLFVPLHIRPEGAPSIEELDDAQAGILALCADLRATGCTTVEHVRWRVALIDRVLLRRAAMVDAEQRLGVWKTALGHAVFCEHVAACCFGADRAEVEQLRTMRERLQMVVDQGVLDRLEREAAREREREGVLGAKMKGKRRARARKRR